MAKWINEKYINSEYFELSNDKNFIKMLIERYENQDTYIKILIDEMLEFLKYNKLIKE